jgi:hypothetical protein
VRRASPWSPWAEAVPYHRSVADSVALATESAYKERDMGLAGIADRREQLVRLRQGLTDRISFPTRRLRP